MIIGLLVLIVVVGVVVAALPLFLPWPVRLRFVLTATAAEPWGAAGASAASLGLREVVVTTVDGGPGWFAVTAAAAHAPGRTLELVGTGPLASVAQLQRWAVTGTPLLLVSSDDGDTSLHGPKHAVGGLWVLDGVAPGCDPAHTNRRSRVGHRHV